MAKEKPRPLADIASAIAAHLKRMEEDPVFNAPDPKYRVRSYWSTGANRAGAKIAIRYVSYQGNVMLTRAEATAYLDWLDAGNRGRHYEAVGHLHARKQ